ncbi:Rad54 N terminal-domain-containing protein [Hysterangium stoloniferum]|nr:Rad54 N terminal-domain-containing protein [Hysterangium stoloniferum]
MLCQAPATEDDFVVDRLQESVRVNRPFKAPTRPQIIDHVLPRRKRKHVSNEDQSRRCCSHCPDKCVSWCPSTYVHPSRPLHDPMQDHVIVLYDPTIDERETDEEGKECMKEEERVNAIKEVQEKNKGLFNSPKSLRSLLGERQQKNQKQQ